VEESNPTLLFLHGFLGLGHDWLPIMSALSSSFRSIAVDLPGHGLTKVNNQHGTTGNNNISMRSISDALLKLLDKLKITNVVPIGYSMGARIALYLSLCHSNKVNFFLYNLLVATFLSASRSFRESRELLKSTRLGIVNSCSPRNCSLLYRVLSRGNSHVFCHGS
jgi:pimeloyl-ACP methyl ester carboxylesterase